MLHLKTVLLAAAALLLAGPAAATTWGLSLDDLNGNHGAGRLIHLDTTYDDVTEAFTWTSVFEAENGMLPDGGWLVVSNGPNPKNNVDEFAILYLDGALGRVTTYVYDGDNNNDSYETRPYIATHENALTITDNGSQRTLSIDLVATLENAFLNDADWDGIQFGTDTDPKIGFWFHPTKNTQVSYDGNGHITGYSGSQGWYDYSDRPVHDVPEPQLLWLVALAGLPLVRRRRA